MENAKTLVQLGWHPIPLGGEGGKVLLVSGVTGHEGVDVTDDETFREWADRWAATDDGLNLATRMPVGVIAIDVDCYDGKPGAQTLAEHEQAWGALPATWSVTARTDGSRKLFFRVPQGWTSRGILGPGVEIVQRHHRYSVAPPSVHAAGLVRAFAPDGHDCGQLPPPEDLPALPEAWRAGLAHDAASARKGSDEDAAEVVGSFRGGAMTPKVQAHLNALLTAVAERSNRFDAMRDAVMGLVRLGAKGERGVDAALRLIEAEYVDAVADKRGGERMARKEFQAAKRGGAQIVAGDPNYRAMDYETGEAFGPEGLWGSGSRWTAVVVDGERLWQRTVESDSQPAIGHGSLTQSLADVVPTKVDWLWWPWIPRGKLTIFEGEPDVGKSTMTLTWASMVTTGGPWPCAIVGGRETHNEKGLNEPGSVVLVGVEDDIADTVVPRLIAAGADRSRIVTMTQPTDDKGAPVPFLIPEDVDRLRRAIDEVDAALVIIDPITAFMSDAVKPGSDTANRKALMTLASVAERTGAAIVLVRHLNKGTGMSAKHRGGGSIAFTALARSALLAAKLPESEDRENADATYGLASIKGNLSRAPQTMGYRLESSRDDPDSPVVLWTGQLDENADQLVGADGAKPDARKAAPARDEAARMIKELLASGPREAKDVRKMVSAETGCSDKTVANAANKLLIVKTPVRGDDGTVSHWTWELPPKTFKAGLSAKSGNKVARNG
ncbi:AAA family ATPase [Gordonia soli]|uniref:DNA primase/polymerase bifunctional N-terminal domain-containing protein n=1 Tax=Gordonia soli NBRC 108243 TaxID=1223545 RepID=M0QMQ8_9ACTN|nr:AAA family ATPase [Gordonia soli]GAC69930.1 hypothetical protein GS4_29_00290 [Gordonia soli NBRC 108243]